MGQFCWVVIACGFCGFWRVVFHMDSGALCVQFSWADLVLVKKPTVAECLAGGDFDHRCIRKNIPYICPSLEIEPAVCVTSACFHICATLPWSLVNFCTACWILSLPVIWLQRHVLMVFSDPSPFLLLQMSWIGWQKKASRLRLSLLPTHLGLWVMFSLFPCLRLIWRKLARQHNLFWRLESKTAQLLRR